MKKFARGCATVFLLCFTGYIIYLNAALSYEPRFETSAGNVVINDDLLCQLRFLKDATHGGAANEMQQYYPEGYVFMNAIYGLSWCELAAHLPHTSPVYKEAHSEIQWSWEEVTSDQGKRIFDPSLQIPYGVFYTGWNNYLLGKKLSVEPAEKRDTTELKFYHAQCRTIAAVIDSTPFPESYPFAAWPGDATVAVASLAVHDKLFVPEFQATTRKWIENVKHHLDTSGLIPHSVHSGSGKTKEIAKGSSQSLILNFLPEIDSVFAREQFALFKMKFLDSRFGLPGIREVRNGLSGGEDIDSGPVIFNIGGAASVVGLRTMALYGETTAAVGLRNSIEAFGMAMESDGKKKYLFGKLPMADAFIAWANSTEPVKSKMLVAEESWKGRFRLSALLAILFMAGLMIWMWKSSIKTFLRRKATS